MAFNERAVSYLREQKAHFSKETLIDELRKSGYPEAVIDEAVSLAYENKKTFFGRFFDFRSPRTYSALQEKIEDFLFGFFVPLLFFFVPIAGLIGDIFLLIFFFHHRRYISYGIIVRWAVGIFVIVSLLLSFFQMKW